MVKLIVAPVIRNDGAGSGEFGAPRGDRTHRGVDYLCRPEGFVYSPVHGTVSKLGHAYEDDLSWRYVQVTDGSGNKHRLFYVTPAVRPGDIVRPGDVLGEAQDISQRYPGKGMQPHIHYELKTSQGEYIDPEK